MTKTFNINIQTSKIMKKIMKMATMALAAVALVVGFAACSSDDDDNKTPEEKGEMTVTTTISYDINEAIATDKADYPDAVFNPDFIKTTITYYDENNKEVTEEIKDSKFSKTITYKKFPAKVGFTLNYELVDENNIDLSKSYVFIRQENVPRFTIQQGENVLSSFAGGKESTVRVFTQPNQFKTTNEFKKKFKKELPTYSIYYTVQADGTYQKQ